MNIIAAVAFSALMPTLAFGQQLPAGFSNYYIGFMTRPSTPAGSAVPPGTTTEEIQKGHLAHLTRLFDEGLLLGAGPITDGGDLRGLVILRDAPRDVLDRRLAEDPAVKGRPPPGRAQTMDGAGRHRHGVQGTSQSRRTGHDDDLSDCFPEAWTHCGVDAARRSGADFAPYRGQVLNLSPLLTWRKRAR